MQNKKQCKIRNTPSRSSDGGLSNDIKYSIKTACKIQAALGRSIYVFLILHDLFFGDKSRMTSDLAEAEVVDSSDNFSQAAHRLCVCVCIRTGV